MVARVGVVRIGHAAIASTVSRSPLVGARRALEQLPLELEQVLEEVVVPLVRRGRPNSLETAGDGVIAHSGAVRVPPSKALFLQARALGLRSHVGVWRSTVGLPNRVTTSDEGHRLLVVHGHPRERLANVTPGRHWVGVCVGPFRIHVDETHLNGAEWRLELAVAAVALIG